VNVQCYGLCIILEWAFSGALDKVVCFSELEKGLALVHLNSCVEYCWHVTPISTFMNNHINCVGTF
jgi:hypothetical protein